MKKLMLASLTSFATAFANGPSTLTAPVDAVFGPKGFDSNDNTEVIVSGTLPNLCYQAIKSSHKVIGNKIEIKVEALNYADLKPICVEMALPYLEVVSVGPLDKGSYEIIVNSGTQFEKKSEIFVDEALGTAVDDNVYANVEFIEQQEGSRTVTLKGHNPSDCFELESIEIVDNAKDTYSVLPKMKKVSSFCPMKMMPFEYAMEVPSRLEADKVLLHVRALDGKSANAVFEN